MGNMFLDTIDRFTKKDIQPLLEKIDREETAIVSNVFTSANEIGLNQLQLPEEIGGAGLDTLMLGNILKKIAETSAGIASVFMFHYSSLFPFITNEKGKEYLKGIISKNRNFLTASTLKLDGLPNVTGNRTEEVSLNVWGVPPAEHLTAYFELDSNVYFSILPVKSELVHIENTHKKLGLHACGMSTIRVKKIPSSESLTLTLSKDEGRKILEATLSLLNLFVSCVAIGNASGAAKHAIRYASERYQGRDIIINHSIIQTMLGKVLARIETCNAAVEKFLQEGEKIGLKKARLIKGFVTENCEWACSDCVQVFGGYGYMKDFSVERHLRDAKTLAAIGGGSMFSFQEYVKSLKGEDY